MTNQRKREEYAEFVAAVVSKYPTINTDTPYAYEVIEYMNTYEEINSNLLSQNLDPFFMESSVGLQGTEEHNIGGLKRLIECCGLSDPQSSTPELIKDFLWGITTDRLILVPGEEDHDSYVHQRGLPTKYYPFANPFQTAKLTALAVYFGFSKHGTKPAVGSLLLSTLTGKTMIDLNTDTTLICWVKDCLKPSYLTSRYIEDNCTECGVSKDYHPFLNCGNHLTVHHHIE